MKYLPRKESNARRRAKASRATEMGVSGHQATMKALGAAAGWKAPVASSNVLVIPEILGGKKRIKSLSKPGNHTYSNETEEELNSDKRKRK